MNNAKKALAKYLKRSTALKVDDLKLFFQLLSKGKSEPIQLKSKINYLKLVYATLYCCDILLLK